MTRTLVRGAAALAVTTLVLTGAVLDRREAVTDDIAHLTVTAQHTAGALATAAQTQAGLSTVLADQQAVAAVGTQLVQARTPFIAAITPFQAALARAEGKVDADAQRARVVAAQQRVLTERTQPGVIETASAEVTSATAEVIAAVTAYEEEQRKIAESAAHRASTSAGTARPSSAGGGASVAGGGLDRVRAALNQVGGGHIGLQAFDGNCSGQRSDACSYSNGTIAVTAAVGSYSQGRLLWAMAHELAHQYQFGVWGPLSRSASFASLFGNNYEKLANCMANVRGYSSGTSCTADQLSFSRSIWGSSVPG